MFHPCSNQVPEVDARNMFNAEYDGYDVRQLDNFNMNASGIGNSTYDCWNGNYQNFECQSFAQESIIEQMTYFNQEPAGNFYPYAHNHEWNYHPDLYWANQHDQSQNFHQTIIPADFQQWNPNPHLPYLSQSQESMSDLKTLIENSGEALKRITFQVDQLVTYNKMLDEQDLQQESFSNEILGELQLQPQEPKFDQDILQENFHQWNPHSLLPYPPLATSPLMQNPFLNNQFQQNFQGNTYSRGPKANDIDDKFAQMQQNNLQLQQMVLTNHQIISKLLENSSNELPSLVDPFHSQEVSQSYAEKVQEDMEEGDTESAETELEGHDKGKEIHYEDFSKYQPKIPFPSALEGNPIGKQKPDQNEDSSDQMLEKEIVDETKAPTEAKFASRMEEAEIVEQEPPKSCIPVMSSMPPSVNLNEENTPQVKLKTISETEAPTKVKFACQMEEAEKVKQEIPKSCIPIMSSMPPSVTLNEEKAPQVEFKIIPPSIRYVFLGHSSTYHLTANINNNDIRVEKLLRGVRLYEQASKYLKDNLTSKSSSLCMHRNFYSRVASLPLLKLFDPGGTS